MLPHLLLIASVTSHALAATVYLAGDSTMAPGGGGSGTQGWGEYLQNSLKGITVQNLAIGGRSARSFTREGHFAAIINECKSGDFCVLEMGHNDGGGFNPDNGRTDCPGTGDETCTGNFGGKQEKVLTFNKYMENAATAMAAKGCQVIISSQTPNNPYQSGTFNYQPSKFVAYAQMAASVAKVEYVDHGQYCANAYKKETAQQVDAGFPNDHTHTGPKNAELVSKAFVQAVYCAKLSLAKYISDSTGLQAACV